MIEDQGGTLSRRCTLACLSFYFCAVAHAQGPSRVWEFDLKEPGTYKVQVQHNLKGISSVTPGVTKVTYVITIGKETQSRELSLMVDRPFIPLITDIPNSQHMRVAISGLPPSALSQTSIYAFNADTVPPGEYYDPQRADFKELRQIRALLAQEPNTIDLGRAKLTIDKMVDPSVDIERTLQQLDGMVGKIKAMPEYGATSVAKLTAIQRYVYASGAWNNYQPFQYDLDDPLGRKLSNKLLSSYIASKKGNCITMPMLFIILGQRVGVDVTLSTAPAHLLVKYKTDQAGWINLEATSGANPAREVWIRGQFPSMTDQSIASGIYLRPLTKTESVAEIAALVAGNYLNQGDFYKAMALADLILEYYPKAINMMILKGSAYAGINRQRFPQYINPGQMTANDMAYLQYLQHNNRRWFAKAEALGWQPETQEQENQYLQRVNQAKQN